MEATTAAHPGSYEIAAGFAATDAAPTITDHPDDLSVDALDTASFSAAATGGTLERWEVLPAGSASWETVPGAATSPLTFIAHGDDDGNQYRAVFDSGFGSEAATTAATLSVDELVSDVDIEISPAAPVGQDVTFTAKITPATATGTVQFELDGNPLGGPVAVSGGQAVSPAATNISAGTHSIDAEYSGDVDHSDAQHDQDFSVTRNDSTAVIIDVDPDEITLDDEITVNVDVTPAPQGGTVQLSVDGTDIRVPFAVDPVTGEGSGAIPAGLAVGDHDIVATFSGDDDLDGSSSAPFEISVAKRSTTTEVSASPPDPALGTTVTLTRPSPRPRAPVRSSSPSTARTSAARWRSPPVRRRPPPRPSG